MSYLAVEWAIGLDDLTLLQKSVLTMICGHAGNKDMQSHPSIALIARESCVTPRSVYNAITVLKDLKIIDVVGQTSRGVKG